MNMTVSLILNFGLLVFLVAVALALARWAVIIEAHQTLLLGMEEVKGLCEQHRISLHAVDAGDSGAGAC